MTIHSFAAHLRRYIDAKPFISIMIGVLILFVILAIFEAGVLFGMHEARHSYRWSENYDRNFGGPSGGFMPRQGTPSKGHGIFGRIASTSEGSIVITDPSHPEERIQLTADTAIRNGNETVAASSLTVGTYVVVLGSPAEDGTITANLVRIMPAPPQTVQPQQVPAVPSAH